MMLISKIKNFHSLFTVLPDFTKLGKVSKRVVGEKNEHHSRFQDEKLQLLNRNYWFFEA